MDILPSKDPSIKLCTRCGIRPRNCRGSRVWCQVCRNEYARDYSRKTYTPAKGRKANLRLHYSLTQEEYDLMLFRQAGVCAICGQAETLVNYRTSEVQALGVDHNHETGQVRELLCSACNHLIGDLEQDRERVKKALKYLKKHDR